MRHIYRCHRMVNRLGIFVMTVAVIAIYYLLQPLAVVSRCSDGAEPQEGKCLCDKVKRHASQQPSVDWEQVFSFVPTGMKSCLDLFHTTDKSDPFDEEFNEQRLTFKQRIRETYKREDKRMGHTGKFIEESLVMHELVKQPFVKTVCETGFNAGHGAFMWLQSNPNVTVFSFDINEYSYVRPMAKFLQKMFPGRLGVNFGDSVITIPEFHETHPDVKCDLILIDGGHTQEVAKADYENFRKMASENSVIIYDNYPQLSMDMELGQIWESAKQKGEIIEIFHCDYQPEREQGFSVGRLNPG